MACEPAVLVPTGEVRNFLYRNTSLVYTIIVRKDVTFNVGKSDIEPAREEAQRQDTTLPELFRDCPSGLAGRKLRAQEYRALMQELRYVNAGRKFTRDEMNERR